MQIETGSPAVESWLIKGSEAAQLLSLSPRKLWELTNCRQIPYVRIGRSVRYDRRDLLAWIDRKKTSPTDH